MSEVTTITNLALGDALAGGTYYPDEPPARRYHLLKLLEERILGVAAWAPLGSQSEEFLLGVARILHAEAEHVKQENQ